MHLPGRLAVMANEVADRTGDLPLVDDSALSAHGFVEGI